MVGFQKGAKTFITSTYTHGSPGTKEIVNKKISGQPVLVDAQGSDFGEYVLITTANRRSSGQSTKDCSTQKLAYTVKTTENYVYTSRGQHHGFSSAVIPCRTDAGGTA